MVRSVPEKEISNQGRAQSPLSQKQVFRQGIRAKALYTTTKLDLTICHGSQADEFMIIYLESALKKLE
jgi:hypothetical protein